MTGEVETLPPDLLAEHVRRARLEIKDFAAFWYRVVGDRQSYATELIALLGEEPVVVLQVRDVRFDNPNALLDDLVTLLERNRAACENALPRGSGDPAAVVLLARSELNLPHVSSPVQLPDWFPVAGGTVVSTRIVDVTWIGAAPLNCSEACIPELCSALLRLEGSLIMRLAVAHRRDKATTNGLLNHIRNDDSESFESILETARQALNAVANPQGYRPSLRTADGFVARLWRCAQTQNPDTLGRVAKALAGALGLPEQTTWPRETMSAILRRPTNRIEDERRRFAFNLVATIAAGCQLSTAAAHSDDYPALPVALIRTTSYDIRRALAESEHLIAAVQ